MKKLNRKGALLLLEGFDVSQPAEYISDRASPNSQNFFVDRGLLRKRNGTSTVGQNASSIIMAGREFTRDDVRYNVRVSRTNVEQYDSVGLNWDDITGAALTGSEDDIVSMAIPTLSGKQILCITNGIDPIRKYDGSGTTVNLGGSPPVAKYIQEYEGYLVAANIRGGVDQGQLVQWPNTFDPENWSTRNAGNQLLTEGGEDISGLNRFGKFLCVHKPNLIYLGRLVSSSAIFQFDPVPTGVGTICNATIQNLPTGEQSFLAQDGIRIFNGMTADPIPSPVNDEIRDSLNRANAFKSWSVLILELDEVWIGMPIGDQTTPDTVYKYNYKTKVLYKDTRVNITAAWRFTDSTFPTWDDEAGTWDEDTGRWDDGVLQSLFPLTMLGSTNGATYKVDPTVNDDAGVAIDAFWESKDFETEVKGQLGRWLELELWAKGISCRIEYSTDGGVTWLAFNRSPVTLSSEFPSDSSPLKLYFDTVSSRIRLRFSNSRLGEPLAIKQFILGYREREMRS